MTRPTRILQVVKSLDRGGAEVLLSEVLKRTDRERYHVAFAYFSPAHDFMVPALEAQGAEVFCLQARNQAAMFARTRRLAKLARDWRADLLHAHLPLAGAVTRMAGRMVGVPVVYTEHNLFDRYHSLTRRASRLTWRHQREVIAVSGEVAKSLEALGGRVPVTVVRNAVNIDDFQLDRAGAERVRAELGVSADTPIVGTVAVFREAKRLDRWIEVARRVHSRRPEVRFVLVGYGPLDDQVRGWVREAGLDGVVHLAGAQSDVRPWMSAFDIYMMSSDFEGLPVALLEAMATGVPVVTTAVGGIPEVVLDGEVGVLVASGDGSAEGLEQGIERLLADPASRRAQGLRARQVVEERFGMERMVREIGEVYERALGRG
ncbi:MAG: glycosyltransferase [Alphaproteobacteria bacterium]|nr:glycosyltransferase [Alphaproteobacteria bacterium]